MSRYRFFFISGTFRVGGDRSKSIEEDYVYDCGPSIIIESYDRSTILRTEETVQEVCGFVLEVVSFTVSSHRTETKSFRVTD